jgi:tetratricopeptide (TPR) repeat protein
LALWQKDLGRAEALLEESLVYCREAGDDTWTAIVLNQLGEVARSRGDHEAGRSFYEKSLAIKRAQGDKRGIATTLANLGYLAIAEGDYQGAAAFLTESLNLFQDVGSKQGIIECLAGFAKVADRNDQRERVVRLLAAAQALLETIGARFETHDRVEFERLVNAARVALGEAAFEAAWAVGRAMMLEQAIDYAFGKR